jgi:cysteine desulfurase
VFDHFLGAIEFMTHREIYFDNNATTKPLPEVRKAMLEALSEGFGNPSSAHTAGDRAREQITKGREAIAFLIGADPSGIHFTSGGTEANNMILASVLRKGAPTKRIVTTEVEHSSVLKMCEYLDECGVEIVYLPVDREGRLLLEDLEKTVTPKTSLVSVQWVNNETGVVQPIGEIARLCRKRKIPFHTDAAQAVGKMEIDISKLNIDFLSLTGHKFHSPQGVGALFAQDHRWVQPMLRGGSQEMEVRAGTENVPGIVGMGKAALLRSQGFSQIHAKLSGLRNRFESLILERIPGTAVNGNQTNRICNTTNMHFRDVDGQALVAQLDQVGIRCSQSSACTNHRPEPSYVLRAMGLSEEEAYSSVRFSFSEMNCMEEVEWAVEQIEKICKKLRGFNTTLRAGVHQETG